MHAACTVNYRSRKQAGRRAAQTRTMYFLRLVSGQQRSDKVAGGMTLVLFNQLS